MKGFTLKSFAAENHILYVMWQVVENDLSRSNENKSVVGMLNFC